MSMLDSATWFINNDSVKKGTNQDTNGYYFPLSDFDDIWTNPNYTDEYIVVKAVFSDNSEIVFKFKVQDNSIITSQFMPLVAPLWANAGIDYVFTDGNTLSIDADLTDGFSLPLPNMSDCSLSVETDLSPSPSVVSGHLMFPATTTTCDITGKLKYTCECLGILNINIHNTACDSGEVDCCDSLSLQGVILMPPNDFGDRILFPITFFSNRICVISAKNFTIISPNTTFDPNIYFQQNMQGCIDFGYHCPPPGLLPAGQPYIVPVEICVTLETGKTCCKSISLYFHCNNLRLWEISPNPVFENTLNINYELWEIPEIPVPLNIAIYDHNGLKRIDVMSEVPTMLSDTIPVNISSLLSGTYYVVFQLGSQIEILQFIKAM